MRHGTHAQELIEILRTAMQDAAETLLEGEGTDYARIERAAEILNEALEVEHKAYMAEKQQEAA